MAPLDEAHREPLWTAGLEPGVWRWMLGDGTRRDVFDDWFDAALDGARAGTEAPFATVDRGEGLPIGSTRYFALRPEHRGLEIGHTWLASSHWGTGANVEAKLLMLENAFERLGCMRVEFKTDSRNDRSRAALAALPATFEGVFRKHMLIQDGDVRHSAYYAIVDDDWPEVKANLERRLAAARR
jgi:RimJ/RimL family protein N-acetyltransferase